MPGASPAAGDGAPALSGSSWTPGEALPDVAVVSLKHLAEAELNAALLSVTATPSGSSGAGKSSIASCQGPVCFCLQGGTGYFEQDTGTRSSCTVITGMC